VNWGGMLAAWAVFYLAMAWLAEHFTDWRR
jgi:hypothetical protein